MADKKISQLTALSAANLAPSTDVLAIVDTSATETKKIVAQDLINGVLNVASAVGIGTASPSQKLDVVGSGLFTVSGANQSIILNTSNNAQNYNGLINFQRQGSVKFYAALDSSDNLAFLNSSASGLLTLDTSGNLGLGVTPNTNWTTYSVLELGKAGGGYIANTQSGGFLGIGNNFYYNGSYKYANNGTASFYYQQSGQHIWQNAASGTAGNAISFTQAMTLDASGNLGVGTTSIASARLNLVTTASSSADSEYIRLHNAGENVGYIIWTNGNGNIARITGTKEGSGAAADDGILTFSTATNTALTERGRFTSGGYFKATNTGGYLGSTSAYHEFRSDADNVVLIVSSASTGANVNNVYSELPSGANAGAYHFAAVVSGAGYQFTVDKDGDVKNTNNSYGSISDVKLKRDIVDAASQWGDIKALRVRKFRLRTDPTAPLMIGLIAQEAESISPGLVEESPDYEEVEVTDEEGNVTKERQPTGTVTKSVKYSVLYMKAVKALQEAMARIESLEAKVAALEAQ